VSVLSVRRQGVNPSTKRLEITTTANQDPLTCSSVRSLPNSQSTRPSSLLHPGVNMIDLITGYVFQFRIKPAHVPIIGVDICSFLLTLSFLPLVPCN
jgi:hypothetical protein